MVKEFNPAGQPNPPPQIDWALIEAEYRSGVYSNRELSRRHKIAESTLRARVKRDGWTQDLSQQVRQAAARKLALANLPEGAEPTDAAIIDAGASKLAEITITHRDVIRIVREMGKDFVDELKADGSKLGHRIGFFSKLVTSVARAIAMERQAYRMDEQDETIENPFSDLTDDELEKQLAEIDRKIAKAGGG